MNVSFDENEYESMISALFRRFPSFQKNGAGAYKPGIGNMMLMDQLAGHPHRKYRTVHVAGTNGKGSVSNMTASALAACGLKVGLYTSPHILDFRERMRIVEGSCGHLPRKTLPGAGTPPFAGAMSSMEGIRRNQEGKDAGVRYISKEEVWEFWTRWGETADHLDLSFFEITTMMAFDWFAKQEVDVAVIETGLGGRLDSTNIITPVLSVITNIGLDHCDMLGNTLSEIAFEKAGIIKPGIPVVVGESDPETDAVFERKVLYTNLPEPDFAGDRSRIMSLLTFADKTAPRFWDRHDMILSGMDLQGVYQSRNLRTVLAVLEKIAGISSWTDPRLAGMADDRIVVDAVVNTAERMDFHGRWEKLCDAPYMICDIGHNAHGLKYNFSQLEKMAGTGKFKELLIVYGSVADKDVDAVLGLLPEKARIIFTNAEGKRALPADVLKDKYLKIMDKKRVGTSDSELNDRAICIPCVKDAVDEAVRLARSLSSDGTASDILVYIGGSTYVVSEAVQAYKASEEKCSEA